jgi:hypothetical protein
MARVASMSSIEGLEQSYNRSIAVATSVNSEVAFRKSSSRLSKSIELVIASSLLIFQDPTTPPRTVRDIVAPL